MKSFRLMQKHGVDFNVIACIQRCNADHPLRVYRFFRDYGIKHIQFVPMVQPVQEVVINEPLSKCTPDQWVIPESVLPVQFGNYLSAIFDEWAYPDIGRIQVLNTEGEVY